MGNTNNRNPLPQYITTFIQITARKTIGKYRLTESDRDDLEQQITLEVIRRRSKFDPAKAKEATFLARVVEHAIADIIAARKADCRDYRREEGSLSQWVLVEGHLNLFHNSTWSTGADLVTEQDARRHLGRSCIDPDELRDLAIDMSAAAATLPERLRRVYDQLKELGSARETANAMGLHRSTIYEAIKEIRKHFEEAGLASYLPESPRSTRQIRPPAGR